MGGVYSVSGESKSCEQWFFFFFLPCTVLSFRSKVSGVYLKAVSRRFNRFNGNISFAYGQNTNQCFGCFVNFLAIFRYIWEEIAFLKRLVKFGELRNS